MAPHQAHGEPSAHIDHHHARVRVFIPDVFRKGPYGHPAGRDVDEAAVAAEYLAGQRYDALEPPSGEGLGNRCVQKDIRIAQPVPQTVEQAGAFVGKGDQGDLHDAFPSRN